MAFIDEVKRRASQARFETDRAMRANRVRSRVTGLQSQLKSGVANLGQAAYDLACKGEMQLPQLHSIVEQLDQIRAQIAAAEAEIRAIQAETFVYDPGSVRCMACGTANALGAHFCSRCGSPLLPPQPAVPPPQQAYAGGPAAPVPPMGSGLLCASCRAPNPAGMSFCQQCGTPLAAAGATPAAAPSAAENPPVPAAASGQESPPAPAAPVAAGTESTAAQPGGEAPSPAATGDASEAPAESGGSAAVPSPQDKPAEAPSARVCAGCGAALDDGVAFCARCGHPAP